jgi:hypothetical protein
MDDGNSFDVAYWQSPTVLDAVRFDLSPYAGRTLTGLAYVAIMSADGTSANINVLQIAFEAPTPTSPLVPLSGWTVDPLYTNAPYAISSGERNLHLELSATDTSSKVAAFNLNTPKLSLSTYAYVSTTLTGTDNARILLRFFMDNGNSFDIAYWGSPAMLNGAKFDLSPYTGRTLTGLVYVALMSSDGALANIDITQITFGTEALPPEVPLSGWEVDPTYTNAPNALSSTTSSLFLELDATDINSKVAIMNLNTPKLNLPDYAHVNVTVTGTDNARILLRFFMDNGSSFDVVRFHSGNVPIWESPADLNDIVFDLGPYAGRTLTGLAYVAIMSADGTTADITITEITFTHV